MGGVGSCPARHNVLLIGDAAGLVNPLQGEGIAQAMISGRLAAEAVLADPARAAAVYAASLDETFTPFMGGASAIHVAMLQRARLTSTTARVLTSPGVRRAVAGTWALYLNGLADGSRPRPSAWTAKLIQQVAGRYAAA
jgi:flavin-dependent dehydrogenase